MSGYFFGGAEVLALEVLRGLKKKGVQLACLSSSGDSEELPRRLKELGIPNTIVQFGWIYKRLTWTIHSLILFPGAYLRSRSLLRKERWDVIHAHSFRPIVMLAPLLRQRVIYHVHDRVSQNRQFSFLRRIFDGKVSRYVAVSQFIGDDLIKAGIPKEKVVIIANGTPLPRSQPERVGLQDGSLHIGIVGQIIPRKGHADLLAALAILHEHRAPPFKLLIIGTGSKEHEAELRQKIESLDLQEIVEMVGFRHGEAIYQRLDLLVVPSIAPEPFGLVAVEAQARGIPVVVAKSGGLPETIDDGVTGRSFEPGNVKELARVLEELLLDPQELEAMSVAARKWAEGHFSAETMVDQIYLLMKEVSGCELQRTLDHNPELDSTIISGTSDSPSGDSGQAQLATQLPDRDFHL